MTESSPNKKADKLKDSKL